MLKHKTKWTGIIKELTKIVIIYKVKQTILILGKDVRNHLLNVKFCPDQQIARPASDTDIKIIQHI